MLTSVEGVTAVNQTPRPRQLKKERRVNREVSASRSEGFGKRRRFGKGGVGLRLELPAGSDASLARLAEHFLTSL